jgi:hypothetical protein
MNMAPSLVRSVGPRPPCKGKGVGWYDTETPCAEPSEYWAEWYGGRHGTSLCRRALCEAHARQWAMKRRLEMPV